MFLLQKFANTHLVGIKVWWWVPRASQQNSLIHILYHVVNTALLQPYGTTLLDGHLMTVLLLKEGMIRAPAVNHVVHLKLPIIDI